MRLLFFFHCMSRHDILECMVYFQCDYAEGCVKEIMDRLVSTNMEQSVGYGMDPWCESAREKIKKVIERDDVDVHFVVGGTQANATVIAHSLLPYQGVLSAATGHIAGHETGAIEATGHKVITLPSYDGKLRAEDADALITKHWASESHEHEVMPGMIYISYPTESGTLYTKDELMAIRSVCDKWDIPLFIDGARMGYGLMSPSCDVTAAEIAALADVFYFGGTKCGALFGEAVVIRNERMKRNFRYSIKQNTGMLAKGRLLGIQFDTLFTDDLYFRYSKHAIEEAMRIRKAFEDKGIEMWGTSMTNQQFAILTADQIKALQKDFVFEFWTAYDEGHDVMRFCTSWATKAENTDKLIEAIKAL